MRNLLIGILLAGAAASPALAQDSGEGRWHHDEQRGGRGEGHQQREQSEPQAQVQPPAAQHEQQQARGPRFGGGNFYRQQQEQPQPQSQPQAREPRFGGDNFYRQQQSPQFVREQRQVEVQRSREGGWDRRGFEGRSNVAPQGGTQQQTYGYRGPVQVERDRNGGWTRTEGYRNGENDQQRVRTGSWYGQRSVVQQQQYRDGRNYAGRTWDRDWRHDRRFDWRRYRESHRSVFRLGLYIDPFGYGYQPYSIGYRLPPLYFGQQYWIDPAMYELPYPPPGTQWVRYWNDALLVDMYTGQVVDVIQGFFW